MYDVAGGWGGGACALSDLCLFDILSGQILCHAVSDNQPECKGGSVYMQCGTACPVTCDNFKQAPTLCTRQCVPRCQCPDGLIEQYDIDDDVEDGEEREIVR